MPCLPRVPLCLALPCVLLLTYCTILRARKNCRAGTCTGCAAPNSKAVEASKDHPFASLPQRRLFPIEKTYSLQPLLACPALTGAQQQLSPSPSHPQDQTFERSCSADAAFLPPLDPHRSRQSVLATPLPARANLLASKEQKTISSLSLGPSALLDQAPKAHLRAPSLRLATRNQSVPSPLLCCLLVCDHRLFT